jgi:hypothetical protein
MRLKNLTIGLCIMPLLVGCGSTKTTTNIFEDETEVQVYEEEMEVESSMEEETANIDEDVLEVVSKIVDVNTLDYYKKTIGCAVSIEDNSFTLLDEIIEVDNANKIVTSKTKNVFTNNDIITKYDLENNTTQLSTDNINWSDVDNVFVERFDELFDDLSTYSVIENDGDYIITSSNLDFIRKNELMENLDNLDLIYMLKGCYLSIIVDAQTYLVKDYSIYINYTILDNGEEVPMALNANCIYSYGD